MKELHPRWIKIFNRVTHSYTQLWSQTMVCYNVCTYVLCQTCLIRSCQTKIWNHGFIYSSLQTTVWCAILLWIHKPLTHNSYGHCIVSRNRCNTKRRVQLEKLNAEHMWNNMFILSLTARPASYYIFSWPQAPAEGEKFILICVVEKFYPNDIDLVWFRNRQTVEKVTQFGPFPCEGDFYSVWSQTEFNLSRDDEGAIFTCQIKHRSFGNVEELSYQINLQGKMCAYSEILTFQSQHPSWLLMQLQQQSAHCIHYWGHLQSLKPVFPMQVFLVLHQPFCWCRTKDRKGNRNNIPFPVYVGVTATMCHIPPFFHLQPAKMWGGRQLCTS